jgi:putrescine transport system permease protein
MNRLSWFNAVSLTLGFAFLYIPMVILIIYSFNAGKLVTVWAGFSTKWYGELLQNEAFLDAAWVTIRVAVFSSTLATVLGTAAAYVLVRGGRFFGRTLFSGMIYAPLVMPEVITGLSLLLLFIGIEPYVTQVLAPIANSWNPIMMRLDSALGLTAFQHLTIPDSFQRGILTIVLAHTTFSMCFVSVVVSSRLVTFDQSLEEAALDLGCSPAQAFRLVTLPIIAPAVISGWLLAFTLSLDDLVIASFTSGPSATTLPIKIFSAVRLGVSPEINALSTLMIAVVTIGVITASLVTKRAMMRQKQDEMAAARAE